MIDTGNGNLAVKFIYENIEWTDGYTGTTTVSATDGGDGDDDLTTGIGNDTLSRGEGDGDSSNNDFVDLSGFYDDLTELRADFDVDGVLDQSNFTQDNPGVVCFTKGTQIQTRSGNIPVEELRLGDLVQTTDNGLQPIRWIGQRRVGRSELARDRHL